jgi:choline dehydrogenase-like flavoprotein
VGRGLHDHISAEIAELQGDARRRALQWFGPFVFRGTTHVGRIEATSRLRQRLGLAAIQAHFTIKEPDDSGFFVLRDLLQSMQRGDLSSALLSNLPKVPSASLDLARLAWTAKVRHRRAVSPRAVMSLEILCEQSPQAGNRVRLADGTRDELGMLKAIVDWRVSHDEVRSIVRFAQWLRTKFEGWGAPLTSCRRVAMHDADLVLSDIRDTNHPMGGTPMGTNSRESVVDAELKIHGLANMYIASCSTYPTGGSSNPTFTLMALSLRMADHLAMKIGRSPRAV